MRDGQYFVEQRKDGKFAVRKAESTRASIALATQEEAIAWVKERSDKKPHVERVRQAAGGGRDQWRKE